jgi:hypothetical protein
MTDHRISAGFLEVRDSGHHGLVVVPAPVAL